MALALGALPWPTTSTVVGRVVSNVVQQNITRRWTQTFSLSDEPPSTAAIRRHPYPSAAPDHDLFEEDDYELASVAGPSTVTNTNTRRKAVSESLLSRLITQRDFSEAERVRDELLAASDHTLSERTSHALISRAIRHTLHHTPPSSARLESFTKWLNFLPLNTHWKGQPFLIYARNALCVPPPSGTYADLEYVKAYCRAAIRKHWATAAMKEMIPFVAQYASPRDMLGFLSEMQAAYSEHNQTKASTVRNHTTTWWIYGVRCAFRADRTDEALALLQSALVDRTLDISQWLQCLEPIRDPSVLDRALSLASQHLEDISSLQAQLAQLPKPTDPLSSAQPLSQLSTHISYLLRHGSFKQLSALRKSHFSHPSLATHFLHALMLSHARTQSWQELLDVFTYHFHTTSVPSSHLRAFSSMSDGRPRPSYFSPNTPTTRLTPTRGITALVWSALVQLNSSDRDIIQELYNTLLSSVQLEHKAEAEGRIAKGKRHFDEAHFAPFAQWAIRIPHPIPQAGLGIVDDMHSLGVRVSMHVHSSIVAAHARRGLPGAAQAYIEELERIAEEEGKEGEKPTPTPETYALAIRIMMGPKPEEALVLCERMKERFGEGRTVDGWGADELRGRILRRHRIDGEGSNVEELALSEAEVEQYLEPPQSSASNDAWVDSPMGEEKAMPVVWKARDRMRARLAEPVSERERLEKEREEKERSVFLVPPLLGVKRT